LVEVAARCLRQNLQAGYDPSLTEIFLGGDDLLALARELKFI